VKTAPPLPKFGAAGKLLEHFAVVVKKPQLLADDLRHDEPRRHAGCTEARLIGVVSLPSAILSVCHSGVFTQAARSAALELADATVVVALRRFKAICAVIAIIRNSIKPGVSVK